MSERQFVGFEGLWSMAIDVPYSYLVRDGDLAWTCGQLALDDDANVVHPGDLAAQSEVVADHVETILGRADLSVDGVERLYLYHVDVGPEATAAIGEVFTHRFGPDTLLVPIPVPHFYYDGVVLEVDVWWAEPSSTSLRFGVAGRPRPDPSRLSEHYLVPTGLLAEAAASPHLPDPGAVIDVGPPSVEPALHSIEVPGQEVTTEVDRRSTIGGEVVTVVRSSGRFIWIQGRMAIGDDEGTGAEAVSDLVGQTEAIMGRFDDLLATLGLGYDDVVKSTTHYVGGATADELHNNMAVRNRRYRRPGPASTGIPVFGFADPHSQVVVDLTVIL